MNFAFRKQQGGVLPGGRRSKRTKLNLIKILTFLLISCTVFLPEAPGGSRDNTVSAQDGGSTNIYLPSITYTKPKASTALIHIPYFNVESVYNDRYSQMVVFWFGKVSPAENFTHVRMGYNSQRLSIEANVYDKDLWYDAQSPSPGEVNKWDAVSMYFLVPPTGSSPERLLRFDSQLSWHEDRGAYQAAYQRSGSGWTRINVPFDTRATHLGEGINQSVGDKGWITNLEIPFTSLGLSGQPAGLSEWKMGIRLYDQNSGANGSVITQVWPNSFAENNPETFATVTFGYPPPNTPQLPVAGSVTIKEGPGVTVPDGSVGGHSVCGGSSDYWSEWGNLVYNSGKEQETVVIQNQRNVSDFPCFSRYYVTFPLSSIPRGKVIVSAKLTMHQFGNSDPSGAQVSFIHVFRVRENWSEDRLSWNNSPPVYENFPGTWVDPLRTYPGEPGVPRTWDVTQALRSALQSEDPANLRLALQSGDWAMHSGKYFWSSETASWNSTTPPTLVVQWANP